MVRHRRGAARGLPLAFVCLYALVGSVPGPVTARAARYGQARPQVQVYTVGQVLAGVRQFPQHWLGRTILVRGIVSGYLTDYPQPGPMIAFGAPSLWLYDPTGTGAATREAYLATLLPLAEDGRHTQSFLHREIPRARRAVYAVRLVMPHPCPYRTPVPCAVAHLVVDHTITAS